MSSSSKSPLSFDGVIGFDAIGLGMLPERTEDESPPSCVFNAAGGAGRVAGGWLLAARCICSGYVFYVLSL